MSAPENRNPQPDVIVKEGGYHSQEDRIHYNMAIASINNSSVQEESRFEEKKRTSEHDDKKCRSVLLGKLPAIIGNLKSESEGIKTTESLWKSSYENSSLSREEKEEKVTEVSARSAFIQKILLSTLLDKD